MPITFQIFEPQNLVYVRLTGRIHLQDAKESLQAYVKDSKFDPNHRQIIDLCQMTDAIAAVWEMSEYKKLYDTLYKDFPRPVSVAMVTSSPFSKRLAWMYSKVMKDRRTLDLHVFHELSSALRHFGEKDDSFIHAVPEHVGENVVHFNRVK